MLPSDDWRFGFAFNKSFHNSLFWSWCQGSVFVLKRCSPVLIQYKKSRHMAGNSSTADIGCIRCWWDRLSPQWELLSQLGILSLLGQHFDIDQVPGMTCMKTIKKISCSESIWSIMFLVVISILEWCCLYLPYLDWKHCQIWGDLQVESFEWSHWSINISTQYFDSGNAIEP